MSATEKIAEDIEKTGKVLFSKIAANGGVAANAALYLYVIVAVLQQSDAQLILPSSVFDLGGLLKKTEAGIPGGSFVTPILQIDVPLTLFYTFAPVGILLLHAVMVIFNRVTLARATYAVRVLAVWSPLIALALIRWRFAPYVSARPEPPPIGQAMESLQTVALGLDLILVVIATLRGDRGTEPGERVMQTRLIPARGFRHAAAIWIIVVLGFRFSFSGPLNLDHFGPAADTFLAAAVLMGWLWEGSARRFRPLAFRKRTMLIPAVVKEDLTMFGRVALLGGFVGLLAMPSFARQIDLTGSSLVGRAPSDALVQTLQKPDYWKAALDSAYTRDVRIRAAAEAISNARIVAWDADGVGISLSKWNFRGGHFDRATMALISLTDAHLEKASLDSAYLVRADLRRAHLDGASFRSAALDMATLVDTNVIGINFSGASMVGAFADKIVQVADNVPGPDDKPEASAEESNPCAHWPSNLIIDLSAADLAGTHFANADLRCANLKDAKMTDETDFNHAYLQGADFTGVQGSGQIFPVTKMSNARLGWSRFAPGAKFRKDTDISDTDFRHAILRGVDFRNVKGFNKAKFWFADLTCAIMPYDLQNATLTTAIITGIKFARPDGQANGDKNFRGGNFESAVQNPNDPDTHANCDPLPVATPTAGPQKEVATPPKK